MSQQTPQKRVLFPHTLTMVTMGVFLACLVVFSIVFSIFGTQQASAATNSTINFQARLENTAGNIAPDGNYFVQFNLYNAAAGGTSLWTEQYQGSAFTCTAAGSTSTGATNTKITVKNGYLTANLGSLCTFPSTINWNQDLWVTLNIGGSGGTASWDGEMNPRLKLTSVPYAFRAGQLAQFNNGNGFTSTLSILQPTSGSQVFQIPDMGAAGTYNVCIANSSACGFALSSGNTNYIQNQIASAQTSSNFWVDGTGRAGVALQAPLIDAATASTPLDIGTTNANQINLNQNVVVASGKAFTANGPATFQGSVTQTAAFQVITPTGTPLISVDTTTLNLVTNSSFETNITNWSAKGSATLSQTSAQVYHGYDSLQAIVSAASSGAQTNTFTSAITPSTQYEVTFMAKCSASFSTFTYGRQDVSGTDINATTTATCNTNWQRYTYHFTTGATITNPNIYMTLGTTASGTLWVDGVQMLQTTTSGAQAYTAGNVKIGGVVTDPLIVRTTANSTNAFEVENAAGTGNNFVVDTVNNQVRINTTGYGANFNMGGTSTFRTTSNNVNGFQIQNSSGWQLLAVDTTLPAVNLISNPGFESANTGWSGKGGSAAPARVTTASALYFGVAAGQVTTTTAAGSGTSWAQALTLGTTYNFSFYARASGSNATGISVGYTNAGGDNDCLTGQTIVTGGFTRYTCSFTVSGTAGTAVYIKQTGTTARTFWIDGAQLLASASVPVPYSLGNIALRGTINSPVSFRNTNDSVTAFQIQNSVGTSNLFVADTLNNQINIGGALNVSNALTTSGTVDLNVMSGFQVEGIVSLGRSDSVDRSSKIKVFNDSTAANNYIKFSVHNGTVGSQTDALTLNGAGDATIGNNLNVGGQTVITSGRLLQNVTADAGILTSGTVSSALLSGSYTGITAVGTLTSLTTSGVITSTVATGTAPLTVASTTTVTNLSADLLDGLDSTAFAAASGSSNYIQNQTASPQTAGFNVNGNGIVGGSLTAAGGIKLNASLSQTALTSYAGDATGQGITLGAGGATIVGSGESASASQANLPYTSESLWLTSDSDIQFKTNIQSGYGGRVDAMSILSNGNIGIGTTTPGTYKLNVQGGDVNFSANATVGGDLGVTGTATVATLNATTVQTGGTTRLDASGNLTNIGNISGSGTLQLSGTTGSSYIMSSLGLGTTNPQAASALTIANGSWISSIDSAGTGYVNMFQVNGSNQIQVGAALNIDGGILLPTNGGQMTLSDLPIDSTATAGTRESYTLRVGSTNALTVYGEADGTGNAQNVRVAVGSSISPAYTLDVAGDLNLSSGSVFRINGTQICSATGCTVAGGGSSYIQNQNASAQTTANFWVSGSGRADGGFVGPSLDAAAGTLSIGASTASTVNIATNAAAHTIAIGNGAAAQGITIGSTNGASSLLLQGGTGNIALTGAAGTAYTIGATNTTGTITVGQSTATNTINIGNGTIAAGNTGTINIGTSSTSTGKTAVTIGSTNGSSTLQLQGGSSIILTGAAATGYTFGATNTTGTITVGQSTATNTIYVGNAAVTGTQTIQIGSNATGTGKEDITIGSFNDGSILRLQAGTGGVAVNTSTVTFNVNNGGGTLTSTTNSATAFVIQSSLGASGAFFTADATKQSINTKDLFVGSVTNVPLGMRLLTDGFETGGYGGYEAWGAYTAGVGIDGTTVHSGKYALKVASSASAESINSGITTSTTVYGRTYFNVSSLGNPTYLEQFGENSRANWLNVYLGASGNLCYTANLSGSTVSACSATAPSTGAWHKLETAVTTGSSTGALQVYLDGVLVTSNANAINLTAQNFGAAQIDSFALGANVASTATVYFDDVAVDVGATGDSSSAYVGDTLHVAGSTSSGTLILSNTDDGGNSLEAAGGINAGGNFSSQGQAGVSSSCTNGQSLTNTQVTGGIVTGGTCSNAVSTLQDAYNNTSVQSGGSAATPAFTGNQATGIGGNVNSDTISIPATTAGNLLVAVIGTGAATPGQHVTGITGGGTWKHAVNGTGGGTYSNMEMWYCYNCGSTTSIVVTFDVKGNSTVSISEYSGVLKASDPLEISAGGSGAGPYTQTTPSITTTNNNDLLVTGASISSGNVTGATTPSGFTALTNVTVGNKHSFSDHADAVGPGSYSATWTLTGGSGKAGVAIAAFKPDVSGGGNNVASILLADAKDYILTAPDTTTDPNIIVNMQCRVGCSTAQGRWTVQSNGTDAISVLYDPTTSITNFRIQSGVDLKLAADSVGAARGAITHDFNCTSSEQVNDIVVLNSNGTVGRVSNAGTVGVVGIVVAKPATTVCTLAFSGVAQVWGGTAAFSGVGDFVQTSATGGAAKVSSTAASGTSIGRAMTTKDGNNLFWVLLMPN